MSIVRDPRANSDREKLLDELGLVFAMSALEELLRGGGDNIAPAPGKPSAARVAVPASSAANPKAPRLSEDQQ